ncbi:DUF2631 domain-containing protein [Rhodococcus zopfii]|uniref:DUF2631 domain-containing protein n=1 Tax=Rhodococcus zopfii TaxID=43772 RepID=A0ABU3WPH7_9NOCA|nr:DUF2631 domain-containing protein [Rhodococcus zopfii]MDV2475866.1 DUF2631 domain-containing protein [Rhodococcus zopfii]
MAGTELQSTHVDTAEVPSAEWGWSGEAPKLFRTMGVIAAIFLLFMIIGNHHGRVEDWYLIGFAALLVLIIVVDAVKRRRPR